MEGQSGLPVRGSRIAARASSARQHQHGPQGGTEGQGFDSHSKLQDGDVEAVPGGNEAILSPGIESPPEGCGQTGWRFGVRPTEPGGSEACPQECLPGQARAGGPSTAGTRTRMAGHDKSMAGGERPDGEQRWRAQESTTGQWIRRRKTAGSRQQTGIAKPLAYSLPSAQCLWTGPQPYVAGETHEAYAYYDAHPVKDTQGAEEAGQAEYSATGQGDLARAYFARQAGAGPSGGPQGGGYCHEAIWQTPGRPCSTSVGIHGDRDQRFCRHSRRRAGHASRTRRRDGEPRPTQLGSVRTAGPTAEPMQTPRSTRRTGILPPDIRMRAPSFGSPGFSRLCGHMGALTISVCSPQLHPELSRYSCVFCWGSAHSLRPVQSFSCTDVPTSVSSVGSVNDPRGPTADTGAGRQHLGHCKAPHTTAAGTCQECQECLSSQPAAINQVAACNCALFSCNAPFEALDRYRLPAFTDAAGVPTNRGQGGGAPHTRGLCFSSAFRFLVSSLVLTALLAAHAGQDCGLVSALLGCFLGRVATILCSLYHCYQLFQDTVQDYWHSDGAPSAVICAPCSLLAACILYALQVQTIAGSYPSPEWWQQQAGSAGLILFSAATCALLRLLCAPLGFGLQPCYRRCLSLFGLVPVTLVVPLGRIGSTHGSRSPDCSGRPRSPQGARTGKVLVTSPFWSPSKWLLFLFSVWSLPRPVHAHIPGSWHCPLFTATVLLSNATAMVPETLPPPAGLPAESSEDAGPRQWPQGYGLAGHNTEPVLAIDLERLPQALEMLPDDTTGSWLGVIVMAPHCQPTTWAFAATRADTSVTLLNAIENIGPALYHDFFNAAVPVVPQKYSNYATVLVYNRVFAHVGDVGHVPVVVDLSRIGGKCFATMLPSLLPYSDLYDYVRPQLAAETAEPLFFIGDRTDPCAPHQDVVLAAGDAIIAQGLFTLPVPQWRLSHLFRPDATWGPLQHIPRESHPPLQAPGLCVMHAGNRYAIQQTQFEVGLSPTAAVTRLLHASPGDLTIKEWNALRLFIFHFHVHPYSSVGP